MTAPQKRPVLVAGAGPVGLSAALELARRGVPVRIVDRKPAPSAHSKAIGINARTLEILEASGATAALLARGLRIRSIQFRSGSRLRLAVPFDRLDHRYGFMLALPQSETEAVLTDCLAGYGVHPERPVELVSFSQEPSGVRAVLRRGGREERVDAAYLVGADGARSRVRETLGIAFPGAEYPGRWRLADVRMEWPFAHAAANLFALGPSALLVFGYNPPGTYRVVSSAGDPLDLLPDGSRVHEVLWTSDFRISRRQAASYQRGRVFLAGDAAHLHSPLGARGMNLGIEDAAVLAHRIAHGGLDGYGAERHRAGAAVLRMTHVQTVLATTRSRPLRTLRDRILLPVLGFAPLQRRILREVMGLGAASPPPVA